MKRFITILFVLSIIFTSTAYADGDPNIDGGGGNTGDGTSENFWSVGNDGVRVTIVRESDRKIMTTPVDFANNAPKDIQMYFGILLYLQFYWYF